MKITRNLKVPTGNIIVCSGEKGDLEVVSLGDYGKENNLKADFLGLSRKFDNVVHGDMLPLTEKWVITISTQYGCSMGCKFCSVPLVGPGKNASVEDLLGQVEAGMSLHPEITWSHRLNVHFARMGEPSWNPDVCVAAEKMPEIFRRFKVHPVVSTMMPRANSRLAGFLKHWCQIKNQTFDGNAGLQLSINSTSEQEREFMFNGNALSLAEIGEMVKHLPEPKGRKYTLNFAISDYEIDPQVLLSCFDPRFWLCKLTPMHKTDVAIENGIQTEGDYTTLAPYLHHEEALKAVGYDVIVFVASREEDESLITCGNAILSGSLPRVDYQEMEL